jgi:sensor histidine kinase regulating citrate/malate metabolism
MSERAVFAQERLRGVTRVAACPIEEEKSQVDLAAELRLVLEDNEAWAARRGVSLVLEQAGELPTRTHKRALRLMLDSLIDHGVLSTPRGKQVAVKVEATHEGVSIRFTDGGPAVPRQSREALLRNATDPTALGRPGGISLLVAYLAAGRLGGSLNLHETDDGRTCVDALLPVG